MVLLLPTERVTAYAQTMGVSLTTGAWTFYKGYGAASDQSLKGDPQNASTEDSLNMLRQVSAKTYRRLDLPDDEGPRLGFMTSGRATAKEVRFARSITRASSARCGSPADRFSPRIEVLEQRVAQLSAPQ